MEGTEASAAALEAALASPFGKADQLLAPGYCWQGSANFAGLVTEILFSIIFSHC
jgi:hypothetical protein